jgi:8-oxo-dGTP pyrophosphatase MutT (NUDIX family)
MEHPPEPTDERLTHIDERLADWRPGEVDRPAEGYREAAVSLVLRAGAELDLLLIRRAESERDPWSGQMALPGGRRDATDESLLHTAIRETREETALELQTRSRVLGRLDTVTTVNERLPKLSVMPIVFGVTAGVEATANSAEVSAVHWVPLSRLTDPVTHATTTVLLPTGPRDFPCFRVNGEVVWGMTHRILTSFLARLS